MYRRDFMGFLLAGTAGVPLFGSLRNAGGDQPAKVNWSRRAIIVGAGAAGLYAAYLLKKSGVSVTILEASNKLGGRIRTLEGFADFPIELGAEYINGKKNILHKLAGKSEIKLYPSFGKNSREYYSVDGVLVRDEEAEKKSDVRAAYRLFAEIAKYKGADVTVAEYLKSRTNSPQIIDLCRIIGIEAGASNERVSAIALARLAKTSLASEGRLSFRSRLPYLETLGALLLEIGNQIVYESPVEKIDYTNRQVALHTANGQTLVADKAIITVPLPVLQKKMIDFVPELPGEKRRAIENMRFGAGMKVILKFRTRFWKPDIGTIGGALATYWQPVGNQFGNDNILTAFAVGEHAEKLSADETRTIRLLLGELDNLFGNRVATQNFLDSRAVSWSNEPFIGGYVAYPNSSSYFADKTALAKPVQNKLFFAGEATNTDDESIGYVHGAMATGAKAARELIAAVRI